MRIASHHCLTVQFHHETQDTVSRWMLWSKIQLEILHSLLDRNNHFAMVRWNLPFGCHLIWKHHSTTKLLQKLLIDLPFGSSAFLSVKKKKESGDPNKKVDFGCVTKTDMECKEKWQIQTQQCAWHPSSARHVSVTYGFGVLHNSTRKMPWFLELNVKSDYKFLLRIDLCGVVVFFRLGMSK